MRPKGRHVAVFRNGKSIGDFPPEQLHSLYETGQLLATDECADPLTGERIILPTFLVGVEVHKYSAAKPITQEEVDEIPEERPAFEAGTLVALSGWIAFLLALAAGAGILFLMSGKDAEIHTLKQQIASRDAALADKEKDYQKLSFAGREIAEKDVVRGRVIIRSENGLRTPQPKIKVCLYTRAAIDDHLAARFQERSASPPATETHVQQAAFFVRGLPMPMAVTTTDSSGRYEFQIPTPGEYVIYTSMSGPSPEGIAARVWMLAFDSRDPLNTAIDISEANAIRLFLPGMVPLLAR